MAPFLQCVHTTRRELPYAQATPPGRSLSPGEKIRHAARPIHLEGVRIVLAIVGSHAIVGQDLEFVPQVVGATAMLSAGVFDVIVIALHSATPGDRDEIVRIGAFELDDPVVTNA